MTSSWRSNKAHLILETQYGFSAISILQIASWFVWIHEIVVCSINGNFKFYLALNADTAYFDDDTWLPSNISLLYCALQVCFRNDLMNGYQAQPTLAFRALYIKNDLMIFGKFYSGINKSDRIAFPHGVLTWSYIFTFWCLKARNNFWKICRRYLNKKSH